MPAFQARRCAITFWSPPDFKEDSRIQYFISGKEICPETKKQHYQSYIEFTKRLTLKVIKDIICDNKANILKCKGSAKQNIAYCKKDGDIYREFGTPKQQGKRNDINAACKVIQTLKRPRDGFDDDVVRPLMAKYPKFYAGYFRHTHRYTEEFKAKAPWQEEIMLLVTDDPLERKIHWYWSDAGKMGKTTVAKALIDHHDACLLGTGHNNVLYAYDSQPVAVFNIPRDVELEHIPYTAMELLKDGAYFVGKYDSHFKRFKPPHVIVFANFPPHKDKLSKDRLIVTCVDSEEAIKAREQAQFNSHFPMPQ